jgi:hypothetical protein
MEQDMQQIQQRLLHQAPMLPNLPKHRKRLSAVSTRNDASKKLWGAEQARQRRGVGLGLARKGVSRARRRPLQQLRSPPRLAFTGDARLLQALPQQLPPQQRAR